jgi:hypothetical protein
LQCIVAGWCCGDPEFNSCIDLFDNFSISSGFTHLPIPPYLNLSANIFAQGVVPPSFFSRPSGSVVSNYQRSPFDDFMDQQVDHFDRSNNNTLRAECYLLFEGRETSQMFYLSSSEHRMEFGHLMELLGIVSFMDWISFLTHPFNRGTQVALRFFALL